MPQVGRHKYVPVLDNTRNDNTFSLKLSVPEGDADYCLTFNFSSYYMNPLLVSAETLNAGYSVDYHSSTNGSTGRVCTSWLNPRYFEVQFIQITFKNLPSGLVDRFWVQLAKAEWVKPKWAGITLQGTGEAKKKDISWADLFVNVPPEFDVSKEGEISFKVKINLKLSKILQLFYFRSTI